MTLLETLLILYILLNWILIMIFTLLPKRFVDKVFFLFIFICPPLIFGFIGDFIKEKHDKRRKLKGEK